MTRSLGTESSLAAKAVRQPGRLTGAVIAGLVAIGLVAGCGSSGSSTTSTTTPAITKAEFVAKANAICTKGNAVTQAAGAKLGSNPTEAQIVAAVHTIYAPSIQAQINSVRALGSPSGEEATVTNILNLAQEDLNKVKADPTLVAKGGAFANFAKVAHPYGLTDCAKME